MSVFVVYLVLFIVYLSGITLYSQSELKMDHLSGLKVNQLKEHLRARGIDSKGGKVALVGRLHDALVQAGEDPEAFVKGLESDGVEPGDSVSQAPSHASSGRSSVASSVRLRQLEEAATQASLATKLKRLRERQEIERQVAELQRQKELLELEEALDVSRARETVLQDFSKPDGNPAAMATVGSIPDPKPISDPEPSPHTESKPRVNLCTENTESKPKLSPTSKLSPEHENERSETMPRCSSRDEREQTAALMRLPVVEIKKFGGDVTEFAHFMRSFDLKIGQKNFR